VFLNQIILEVDITYNKIINYLFLCGIASQIYLKVKIIEEVCLNFFMNIAHDFKEQRIVTVLGSL
jgi:hypothetical protein